MKKITIILMMCSQFLSFENVLAQREKIDESYYIVPKDSLIFDGYRAVTYQYQDSAGQPEALVNAIAIYEGEKKLIFLKDNIFSMFSFCGRQIYNDSLPYIKDNCYLQDINRDGHKEIIISYSTGGADCCDAGYLYSLNDTAKLLLEMKPTYAGFNIIDLENDSIPEIITWDDTFNGFFDYPFQAFLQRIIWRRDGDQYRIANMRFTKYYLETSDAIWLAKSDSLGDTISSQIASYRFKALPDVLFWDTILDYYFTGRPAQGDSIFNNYWPPISEGKGDFYNEFKKRITADRYWPQILKSNW